MKKTLKKLVSILVLATITISMFINTSVVAGAVTKYDSKTNISINSTDVTIYAIEDWATEYISIPSNYYQSFQLVVSGAENVYYYVDGYGDINISNKGLITPKVTTYYWYGNYGTTFQDPNQTPTKITNEVEFGESTIIVYADDVKFEVKVNVVDYSYTYSEKIMDDYVSENINSNMTTYEKLDVIAKFVANKNYSPYYSSYAGMIISGGGDCWASTNTIIYMSEKAGLQAWSRNGNRDYGAGSGHMNAMVFDGKDYYEVEAGYSGDAPRYYYVDLRDSIYSYRYDDFDGIQVYQYDGETYPSELTIPSEINEKKVTSIGEYFAYSYGNSNLKKVILPDTLKQISFAAFFYCENLKSITIPKSVVNIESYALGYLSSEDKVEDFTIYGYKNTVAEEYANANGFKFVALDGDILSGDVNNDGIVNVIDATEIQKYLAGIVEFNDFQMKVADYNGDSTVSIIDATNIQKKLAGLI